MKKIILITVLAVALVLALSLSISAKPEKSDCATIQDGTILYSLGHYLEGTPIATGFDEWGYNYQGHMFKGLYANSYFGGAGFEPWVIGMDEAEYLADNPGAASHWAWPYREVKLAMKWNDASISNTDCDDDTKLDRHFGFPTYIGSGAWLTNHQSGEYELDGKIVKWNYFVKIVAAPADATVSNGFWIDADGTEIGPVIWGQFAIIQQVENDPGIDVHGAQYISPSGPGFGQFQP